MSSQALLRVGEASDFYYSDEINTLKQAIPVEYDSRFQVVLSNPAQGVSIITLPPNQGYLCPVLVLGYSAAALAGQNGANCLTRGWGYSAVKQISFRIGGSAQYFLSGAQLLARNMAMVRTQSQKQSMLNLGGQEAKLVGDFATDQYAYIPLSIWCPPGTDHLNLPLSSDLLSQQVQLTVELNPPSAFWNVNGAAPVPAALPNEFTKAYVRMEQIQMNNRGDALANRVDMATHLYAMPMLFHQQEIAIPFTQTGSVPNPLTATGFRSGECKGMIAWLTNNADSVNKLLWYVPKDITVLYAGTIYSQYEDGTAQIFNLIDGTAENSVGTGALVPAGGAWTSSPANSQWCFLPFAQPQGEDYAHEILVHGKEILNGVVNLQVTAPSAGNWTLHLIYAYNSVIGFSKGSAEIIM